VSAGIELLKGSPGRESYSPVKVAESNPVLAAASSEKDQGDMNLASNAFRRLRLFRKRRSHPSKPR
jgi:hypothetical protein